MSASVALSDAVITALRASPAVAVLIGGRVYDQAPRAPEFPYITMGPSFATRDDADCIPGRDETLQVDIWARDDGRRWPCRRLVDVVAAALHGLDADLGPYALVSLEVTDQRVLDDPDGITRHGVVEIRAMIEG